MVLPECRVVIFVHGRLLHQRACASSKLPQSGAELWTRKLAGNKHGNAQAERQPWSAGWG